MSISINNLNHKITTLNATKIRKNLSYLVKFELSPNIAQHTNSHLIFYDIYNNNLTKVLDIKLYL